MADANLSRRWLSKPLASLQFLIGLLGVAGGLPAILDPSGATNGFRIEWLASTPFDDFLIPGIVLFSVNGLGNLVGAVASFRRHRRAGEIAVALGTFLLVWMVAQVSWIGLFSWMQPLFFVLGIAEVTLGLLVRKSLKAVLV
jgi:hypothetical protein